MLSYKWLTATRLLLEPTAGKWRESAASWCVMVGTKQSERAFVSEYTFREKESHDLLAETIVIIFAEMAHFDKRAEECVTETDRMLYVLKFIGRMMEQPAWLQNEVYTRIFSACEIAGFPEDKRIKYEQEMNDEKRLRSEYNTARRMGLEEGREEGREEARLESARKLKQMGVAAEIIAEATGLSIEEICKLGE